MKALILAGGKGTRLSSLTGGTVPKPMAEMDGKPVLLRAVESLKRCGVTDFLFTVGHLHEKSPIISETAAASASKSSI